MVGVAGGAAVTPGGAPGVLVLSLLLQLPFWNFLLGALSRLFALCRLFVFLIASLSKSHPGCLSQSLCG